jgi:hypothetical protein
MSFTALSFYELMQAGHTAQHFQYIIEFFSPIDILKRFFYNFTKSMDFIRKSGFLLGLS